MSPKLMMASMASTALSAASSIAAGRQQKAAYDYNAQIDERNALAKEIQAEVYKRNQDLQIQKFRQDFRRLNDATSQAFRKNGFVATGGTKSTSGDKTVHTFTSPGTFTVSSGSRDNLEYLVVAGGGGAGNPRALAIRFFVSRCCL